MVDVDRKLWKQRAYVKSISRGSKTVRAGARVGLGLGFGDANTSSRLSEAMSAGLVVLHAAILVSLPV